MKTDLDRRRMRARRLRALQRYATWGLVSVAAFMLFGGLPWLVWKGPYVLDSKYIDIDTVGDGTGSAALVTGLRTALVACVAALGAGIALFYTARNYRLTRRGQVTERFTKALERLGSDEIYVRIGGILALEQIVQDAPDQATDAAHVLGHFIRHRAPAADPAAPTADEAGSTVGKPQAPDADVQAALTALTRHESRTHVDPREILDLRGLCLAGARLNSADLTDAVLNGTDLRGAEMNQAKLTGARLNEANLSGAWLNLANLSGSRLNGADLSGAGLNKADLSGAQLDRADLTGAGLNDADLSGAGLVNAKLAGAGLNKANLSGSRLNGADLSGAGLNKADLSGAQLDGADLTGAGLDGADLSGTGLGGA
ncbi:pentapeptide repeat-containing protein [Streptomyces sp. SD31]|uniref:pentapeptide repeat-containing protein n=1 Tax=Streptomyces sp. SD31 TaxID=3452208 RepID=UPI003F8C57A6